MDNDAQFTTFEIDPVISQPIPVELLAFSLEFTKTIQSLERTFEENPEMAKDIQLQLLEHLGKFLRLMDQNNLKRSHITKITAFLW